MKVAELPEAKFWAYIDELVTRVPPWSMEQRVFVRRCFPGEWSTFLWGVPALWPMGGGR